MPGLFARTFTRHYLCCKLSFLLISCSVSCVHSFVRCVYISHYRETLVYRTFPCTNSSQHQTSSFLSGCKLIHSNIASWALHLSNEWTGTSDVTRTIIEALIEEPTSHLCFGLFWEYTTHGVPHFVTRTLTNKLMATECKTRMRLAS